MAAIEVRGLVKRYGKVEALKGISFSVEDGETFGLVGPNGAGKTTTLKILAGVRRPTEGYVAVFGRDPSLAETRSLIGYVSETPMFYGNLNAFDWIGLAESIFSSFDRSGALKILEQFGIDPSRKLKDLSKGQRAIVSLAVAVSHGAKLLLLDEPAAAFDPVVRKDFFRVVIENASREGTVVVFSSHRLEDVERLCSRVAIIVSGEIVKILKTDELPEGVSLEEIYEREVRAKCP